MNKNSFRLMVMLAGALVWAGCNKAGKLETPSKLTPPSGPVELKWKWPVGERALHRFDMRMNSVISVPSMPQPIKQAVDLGQEYALTVLQQTPDGGHEVELEFLSVRMMVAMGGRTNVDYDSAKPAVDTKNETTAMLTKPFDRIIGTKIQYYLDASNQVQRIDGVDALLAKFGRSDAGGGGNFKDMFSEGYLKQLVSGAQLLPSKPVQPGDTWPVHLEMAMNTMGNMTLDYNYTLQGWEKYGARTCARMEFQGTVKNTPGASPLPNGMTINLQDGTLSGVSWFDPELGLIVESDVDQDMNMVMNVPINERGMQVTQTMTNQMHQTIVFKLESVK